MECVIIFNWEAIACAERGGHGRELGAKTCALREIDGRPSSDSSDLKACKSFWATGLTHICEENAPNAY